jgi:hypothetical protein
LLHVQLRAVAFSFSLRVRLRSTRRAELPLSHFLFAMHSGNQKKRCVFSRILWNKIQVLVVKEEVKEIIIIVSYFFSFLSTEQHRENNIKFREFNCKKADSKAHEKRWMWVSSHLFSLFNPYSASRQNGLHHLQQKQHKSFILDVASHFLFKHIK